jgi:prepilin-type N-terminal cleavage/methylation domain-containing protein
MSIKSLEKGFSLLEVAIVIVIIGIVMAGFVLPMLGQIKIRDQLLELQKYKETKRTLEEIKQALLGYVATNKYFPCPDFDVTQDGLGGDQSNCNTAATAMEGYVPWVDLGLTKGTDAWGNPIRYRVHHNYAYFLDSTYSPAKNLDISTINPDVTANPALRIKDHTEKAISSSTSSNIAIVLLSCGKNGKPDSTTNESNNRTGNQDCLNIANPATTSNFYIQDTRDYSKLSEIPTDFDDVLTWISKYQVINALNNAGKWK